jgi:hypothetical protein
MIKRLRESLNDSEKRATSFSESLQITKSHLDVVKTENLQLKKMIDELQQSNDRNLNELRNNHKKKLELATE